MCLTFGKADLAFLITDKQFDACYSDQHQIFQKNVSIESKLFMY